MGGDNYQTGTGQIVTFFLIFCGVPLVLLIGIAALIFAVAR